MNLEENSCRNHGDKNGRNNEYQDSNDSASTPEIVVLQTEQNLKELRTTSISRWFIFYLYLVSFSCMSPELRINVRLITYHACLLALRWTPKEDWLLDCLI